MFLTRFYYIIPITTWGFMEIRIMAFHNPIKGVKWNGIYLSYKIMAKPNWKTKK